ncbi:MAG: hypothetical protein NC213_07885 [Acetobacter sp.]|nr:hypothetical protein [Bacteroides sp.]MCM1341650.1 hypothetical protein [Acetobacter sp.]MCM1434030.1 hypothetical protein [Clostridiales bacterium]
MDNKSLAIQLSYCESEREVIDVLTAEGYWNDETCWRAFGDNENNWSTIGNQQSDADKALVEKIVNSIDAILMKECLIRKIDPESSNAPHSVVDALQGYFKIKGGKIENLTQSERTNFAKSIVLAATGAKPTDGSNSYPNITIADKGEGQTPNRMPDTILSINKSNKLKVPFVQGKFNMGGTGVLRFCGSHNIQLIISKRCPEIDETDETKSLWGVTVIRRIRPKNGMRSSLFQYLTDNKKKILSFDEPNGIEIIPTSKHKYETMYYGMFCKMFEYNMSSRLCSNINMNLYSRLSTLLPNLAYPVFMDECRDYKAHSMFRTLSGLNVRLRDNETDENTKIEEKLSVNFTIESQNLSAAVYVFKKDEKNSKASDIFSFGADEGIILTQNGQTHGNFDRKFYRRNSVGLSYLADSILTIIDCSNINEATREDLFMNSRDRMSAGGFASKLESELVDYFKNNSTLKSIQQRRREEAISNKLDDEKPLEDVLKSVFKSSSVLSKLFITGERLSNPLNLGSGKEIETFEGKFDPTFFTLSKKKNEKYVKEAQIGRKFRIKFKTDVNNDFFSRDELPGVYTLMCNGISCSNHSINLHNGTATLSVELPDSAAVGEQYEYFCVVRDNIGVHSFENEFLIKVIEFNDTTGGGGKINPPSNSDKDGNLLAPTGISLPNVIEITKGEWEAQGFEKETALKITQADPEKHIFDFYVNMDNLHLQTELKTIVKDKIKVKLYKARYKYSLVLIGLSILGYYANGDCESKSDESVEDIVEKYTKMLSPVILPMIEVMGSSDLTDLISL